MALIAISTKLAIEARSKRLIENSLTATAMTPGQICECNAQIAKYLGILVRTRPCQKYNCHGMTFAARRSMITMPTEISKIINDDSYDTIDEDNVLPGDIVIYRSSLQDGGEAEHSGFVIERHFVGKTFNPKIVSKWGNCQEVIHRLYHSPYDASNVTYHRVRT